MAEPRGAAPRVGQTFAHYRLEQVIGLGGMGMVLGARDLHLNRPVAVKVVLGQYAESGAFLARFQREAATLARLDSPHVVSIYDHGEQDGWPYIVTQYAGGGDLGRLLAQRGAMPPGLALQLCAQVADALVAAHAVGVVHRDVKPANVLLRDDRLDRLHVYLCDFGVALSGDEGATGLTSPGSVAGSWNYLAPERVDGEPGSPASDIYAVGCLLWEALTGRPPYLGSDVEVAMEHVRAPVPQLPGGDELTGQINRILALTMAKSPGERYPSALALRDDLRAVAGLATTGSGAPLPPGRRRSRRGLIVAAVAAVVVLAGAGTAVALTVGGGGHPSTAPTPNPTSAISSPPPSPGAERAILDDVNGDGHGDVGWAGYDQSQLHYSDGKHLASKTVTRQGAGDPSLLGDVDGDGTDDLVTVSGSPPLLAVTVASPTNANPSTPLRVPPDNSDRAHLPLALADVDGDGHADLVIATRQNDTTKISVALGSADLTFAAPKVWYEVPKGGDVGGGGFVVADFDGDGTDDLGLVELDDSDYEHPGVVQVVVSKPDQHAFEPLGSPLKVPTQVKDIYASFEDFQAADVNGDGKPEVVGMEPFSDLAVVWLWNGAAFSAPEVWHHGSEDPKDYEKAASQAALSDVDGDGRADLLLAGNDRVRVMLSDGTSFEPASSFTLHTKLPDGWQLLGPASTPAY